MMNAMNQSDVNSTRHRLESSCFLSSIFLTLPDEAVVTNLLKFPVDQPQQSPGMQHICGYIKHHELNSMRSILKDLSTDRVKLFRGITKNGPRPPYESLFVNQPPQDIIGGLNQFYAKLNCSVSKDIKESPEQIGVEFSYMKALCEKELEAIEDGLLDQVEKYRGLQQSFLRQHLGRWAGLFAKEMECHAQTDFYRGIALLIQELIQEELATAVH
jgi:TorA maturation chaperone TorD